MDSLDLVALDFLEGAIGRFLDGKRVGSLEELEGGGFGCGKSNFPECDELYSSIQIRFNSDAVTLTPIQGVSLFRTSKTILSMHTFCDILKSW
jgi:hypothetical protein